MSYTLKKSLGQHFLKDESVSQRIVAELQRRPLERLAEVGPGGAALTKYLLQLPNIELLCVEIDDEKVQWLTKNYPALEGKIIHESILDIEPPFKQPFTLVGNFPYNISTQIVFRVLEWRNLVECMIGMFQKEVADRIAAPHGSKVYGVTSVLVQAWYNVETLFYVDESAFIPPPKVKSSVIRFLPKPEPVPMHSEQALFMLVKAAFSQRRKTLRNSVRSLFEPAYLEQEIFSLRPEQLSVEQFGKLSFHIRPALLKSTINQ